MTVAEALEASVAAVPCTVAVVLPCTAVAALRGCSLVAELYGGGSGEAVLLAPRTEHSRRDAVRCMGDQSGTSSSGSCCES